MRTPTTLETFEERFMDKLHAYICLYGENPGSMWLGPDEWAAFEELGRELERKGLLRPIAEGERKANHYRGILLHRSHRPGFTPRAV